MNDNQIIDLFWAKNQLAISATAEKYGSYCFSVAYNILYDRLDSEECVNDTYLGAWNSIPPQKPNRLLAFLGKITRNLALNRYKRNRAAKRGNGQVEIALSELEKCHSRLKILLCFGHSVNSPKVYFFCRGITRVKIKFIVVSFVKYICSHPLNLAFDGFCPSFVARQSPVIFGGIGGVVDNGCLA